MALLVVGTPFFIPPLQAATGINEMINFQGKLVDNDGLNVTDGNYDMVFKLYSTSSGGTALWTETWNSGTSQVGVLDGVFRISLGTHSSLASFDFNRDELYLSITVGTDSEMSPRVRFTAVPYAFVAKTVEDDALDFAQLQDILDVDADLTVNQTTNTWSQSFTGTTSTGFTYDANSLTSGKALYVSSTASGLTGNLAEFVLSGSNAGNTGNVVRVANTGTSSGAVPLMVTNLGTGLSFRVNDETGDADTSPFVVDATGNVGVGTASPGYKFVVDGSSGDLSVLSSGNVHIGTYPNYNGALLHVMTTDSAGGIVSGADVVIEDSSPTLQLLSNGTGTATINIGYGGTDGFVKHDANTDIMSLGLNSTNILNLYNGNVGIGTTSPGYKMEIVSGQASDVLSLTNTSNTGYSDVRFVGSDTNYKGSFGYANPSASYFADKSFWATASGVDMVLAPNLTESMRLLSSNGYVGIGSTNPSTALHVAGATGITVGEDKTAGSSNTVGVLDLVSAGDNAYSTSFTAGTQTADISYTLPTANVSNGYLTNNGSGVLSWSTSVSASSLKFNNLIAADNTNTIDNATYAQTWNWNTLSTQTGLTLGTSSTALTTGGLFSVSATGAPAGSWTGDLAKIEYNNADADVNGNALKVGLLGTDALGSGTALNVTTSQTGTGAYALRINDDGSYTDSTPFVVNSSGNVGIGTTNPNSTLEIGVPGVATDNDVNFYGNYSIWDNNENARFFWDASKGSFGVGSDANGTAWDNLGLYAVALGYNTTASGDMATAMGYSTTASNNYSIAMGYNTTASGMVSTALGESTIASAIRSMALNNFTIASGENSVAMGESTTAQAYDSVVLGRYNVVSGTTDSWVATDPLFVIGNGTGTGASASNALTILKNGNVGIGTTNPGALLDIGLAGTTLGTLRLEGNTSGYLQIQPSAAAGSWTLTLPSNDGDDGQFLKTNGSGTTSWVSAVSSPGGSDTQVQFNNAGAFDGDANFAWDDTRKILTVIGKTSQNMQIGSGAGYNQSAGTKNTILGYQAGYYTDGSSNVLIGNQTGYGATGNSYSHNIALGDTAGYSLTTGGYNILAGTEAGYYNQTGTYNTAIGYRALHGTANYTGSNNNIAIGQDTGYSISSNAINNILLGPNSAYNITSGTNNFMAGAGAGYYNQTGTYNTAIGYGAIRGTGNYTGSDNNIAIGAQAGYSIQNDADNNLFLGGGAGYANTSGSNNILLGYTAGYANTTGNANFFSGYEPGYYNQTGNYNTAIGYQALRGTANYTHSDHNIAIGQYAGYNISSDADYNTFLGYAAGYKNTTGINNFFSGNNSGYYNQTGSYNTAIGFGALLGATDYTGSDYNIAIGTYAGYNISSNADFNIFLGSSAGYQNTTGSYNIFSGYQSGYYNQTGTYNTALGYYALRGGTANYTGSDNNIAIGQRAGYSIQSNTDNNTFLGYYAGYQNTTGTNNFFSGYESGRYSQTGTYNTAIGYQALRGTANYTGSDFNIAIGQQAGYSIQSDADINLLLGYNAGYAITTGDYNILLGYTAGNTITTGDTNILIGHDVDTPANSTSSYLSIGNLIFASGGFGTGTSVGAGNVGIGTTNPTQKLHVEGSARITGALYDSSNSAGSNTNILTSTGTGTAWTTLSSALDTTYFKQGGNSFTALAILGTNDAYGLAFETNNTEWMRITSAGDVGIGTTNPAAKLSVISPYTGSATAGEQYGAYIGTPYYTPDTGMKQGLRLDTSANNTSGTISSVEGLLSLVGNNGSGGTTDVASALWTRIDSSTGHTTNNAYNLYIGDGTGAGTITSQYGVYVENLTKGTNNYSIYTGSAKSYFGGNVGIGTTDPGAKLDVAGGNILLGNNYYYQQKNASGTIRNVLGIDSSNFTRLYSTDGPLFINPDSSNITNLNYNTTGDVRFFIDKVTMNSSGYVGIGTTNPGQNLEVNGSIRAITSGSELLFPVDDGYDNSRWMIGQYSRNDLLYKNYDSNTTITGNTGTATLNDVTNLINGTNENVPASYATIASTSDTVIIEITNANGLGTVNWNARWWPSVIFRNYGDYAQSITVEARYDGDPGSYQNVWSTTTNTSHIWVGSVLSPTGITSPHRITALKYTLTNWISTGTKYMYSIGLHNGNNTPFPQYVMRTGSTLYGGLNFSGVANDITTAGTEHLSLMPGGNVGIGTTDPIGKLHIAGDEVRIGTAGTVNSATGDGDLYVQDVLEVDGNSYLKDTINFGTLGVNTSSVLSGVNLQLGGTGTDLSTFYLKRTSNTADHELGKIAFGALDSGFVNQEYASIKATIVSPTAGNEKGRLDLSTFEGGSDAIRLSINGGNVGIGTTAPDELLSLYGANKGIKISNSNDPVNYYMTIKENYDQYSSLVIQQKAHTIISSDYSGSNLSLQPASGNVGIGTTVPATKLDVFGDIYTSTSSLGTTIWGNGSGTGLKFGAGYNSASLGAIGTYSSLFNIDSSNGPISFQIGGAEKMRIDNATGNVGIGTTNPTAKLSIAGTSTISNNTGNITISPASNLIISSGSVGIGTTNPGTKLDINDSSGPFLRLSSDASAASEEMGGIQWNQTTGTAATIAQINSVRGTSYYDQADMRFHTNPGNSAGLQQRMIITSAGYVGIGTTNPGSTLEVNGVGSFSLGTVSLPGIIFGSDTNTGMWSSGSDTINFSNNGTENMRITSAGNVGIGTTNPGSTLTVNGVGSFSLGTVSLPGIIFGSDTNTGMWSSGSDTINFSNNGTENMRITSAGNVGIGNTNPAGRFIVNPPSTETIGSNSTITADACGTVKRITSSSSVTTNTTNTFTAPSASNDGCIMNVVNIGASYTITLDANTNFKCGSGTNKAVGPYDALTVFSDGTYWYMAAASVAANSDLAEWYMYSGDQPEAGDLVSASSIGLRIAKSASAYDQKLLGVVSTNPAITLGPSSEEAVRLALSGRIPAKVIMKGDQIVTGDYISSSTIPGIGMKATKAGQIVGKALESTSNWNEQSCSQVSSIDSITWPEDDGTNPAHPCYRLPDGSYVGKLMVFVNLSWADPDVQLAHVNNFSVAQNGGGYAVVNQSNGSFVDRVSALSQSIIGHLIAGSINAKHINTEGLSINGQSISEYVVQLTSGLLSGSSNANNSIVETDGNIGIGTTNPSSALEVDGRIEMTTWIADGDTAVYKDDETGAIGVQASDARLKKNLTRVTDALSKIEGITTYFYNTLEEEDGAKKRLGVLAQDVKEVLPEATFSFIGTDGAEYYGVHYDKLGPLLIAGLQEQQYQINEIAAHDYNARIEALDTMLGEDAVRFATIEYGMDVLAANTRTISEKLDNTKEDVASLSASLTDLKSYFDVWKDALFASNSGALKVASSEATFSNKEATMSALTVQDKLQVNHKTTTFDLTVINKLTAGTIEVGGGIRGDEINAVEGIRFQTLSQGPVDFMGGKVIIDVDGSIRAKHLKLDDSDISSSTVGEAVIKAGTLTTMIPTSAITEKSLVFITPTTLTNKTLSIMTKTADKGFQVGLSTASSIDIAFQWLVVN